MDVIFDIDGTLANAEHRLHLIKDEKYFVPGGNGELRPDWAQFLSEEMVRQDTPIMTAWRVLESLLYGSHARVLFITGRPERQRDSTYEWLTDPNCDARCLSVHYWQQHPNRGPVLYMRSDTDRRPSHEVKEGLLEKALADGFEPELVFEDRKDDTAMWRRNGLLCCHVAEGDY